MIDIIIGFILLFILARVMVTALLFGIVWLMMSLLWFMLIFWVGPASIFISAILGFISAVGML